MSLVSVRNQLFRYANINEIKCYIKQKREAMSYFKYYQQRQNRNDLISQNFIALLNLLSYLLQYKDSSPFVLQISSAKIDHLLFEFSPHE